MDIVTVVIGVIVGAGLTYTLLRRRKHELEQRKQALVEENETLRKHAAEAEGAAARSRQLQQKVDALRERNTALETRVAAAEAARESERESLAGRIRDLESRIESFRTDGTKLRAERSDARQRAGKAESALASERKSHEARLEEIRRFGEEIERKFGALSARALERSGQNFLQLVTERFEQHKEAAERDLGARQKEIRGLVRPLGDKLHDFRKTVDEIEKDRAEARGKLEEQVRSLAKGQSDLSTATDQLVQALRKPQAVGQWGELQLRNALEMAGMVPNQDFVEQQKVEGGLKPDVIVRLPGSRAIVVDAKTPLEGYLKALRAETKDEREQADQAHAARVRDHVDDLAGKEYWNRVPESVDFVVMFVPGEAIFAHAIEAAPTLLDYAVKRRVLISTPTTLIALAKAIAYGWKQEQIAKESREIARLGRELFQRLTTFAGHLQRTGTSLRKAVEQYNKSVGSFERWLLPAATRFDELDRAPSESSIEARKPVRVSDPVRRLASSGAASSEKDRPTTTALPATTEPDSARISSDTTAAPLEAVNPSPVKATSSPVPPPRTKARAGSRQEILDDMLRLLRQIEPDLALNPKKTYVGLLVGGRPRNFVRFKRRREGVLAVFSLPDGESLRETFDASGLDMRVDSVGHTVVPLTRETVVSRADFLLDLARRARDAHQGPGRGPRRRTGTRGRP